MGGGGLEGETPGKRLHLGGLLAPVLCWAGYLVWLGMCDAEGRVR